MGFLVEKKKGRRGGKIGGQETFRQRVGERRHGTKRWQEKVGARSAHG